MIYAEEEESRAMKLEHAVTLMLDKAQNPTMVSAEEEESCAGASIPQLGRLIRKAVPELSPFTCRQVAEVLDGLNAAVSLMWKQGSYDPRPIA